MKTIKDVDSIEEVKVWLEKEGFVHHTIENCTECSEHSVIWRKADTHIVAIWDTLNEDLFIF